MPRRRGDQRRRNDNLDAQSSNADVNNTSVFRLGSYTVSNDRTFNPRNNHPFSSPQQRPYGGHQPNLQRLYRGNTQFNTRSCSSYDHHFLLRSKCLKQHLIHSTDKTLREIQQWLPDQMTKQDENEMDWQPELAQAIPQLAVVVRYPWDLPKSEVTDVCVNCKKSTSAEISMETGMGKAREKRRTSDGDLGGEQWEPPKNTIWSTTLAPKMQARVVEMDIE